MTQHRILVFCSAAAAFLAAGLIQPTLKAGEAASLVPAPAVDAARSGGEQVAVLSGGCFWGVQGVFEHVRGVTRAVSGYSGGAVASPSYEQVSSGATGHAESVEVHFDPSVVSYGDILRVFFSVVHDPTQIDRQGPDEGTQYRTAIFAATSEQERVAKAYIAQLDKAGVFRRPIATKVSPLTAFYPAEAYHQDYLRRHPDQPYIVVNDLPKIADLKRLFPALYHDTGMMVGKL